MTTGINSQTALLAIGILQPVTAGELRQYLRKIFPDVPIIPPKSAYDHFLEELELSGRAISFQIGVARCYSLTIDASHELSAAARRVRDKRRLYLLRSAYSRRVRASRGKGRKELAGASPASDARSSIKVREAKSDFALAEEQGQNPFWPRIPEQFNRAGPKSAQPRDTLPPLVSFINRDQAARAAMMPADIFQLDVVGLATVVGISPKLIAQVLANPDRHYRAFFIPKRGGGLRQIESPRIFLKMIQRVLLGFILTNLRVSSATHAFRIGRSIVSNALGHVGRRFVAGIDIHDFFGSITTAQIEEMLERNGYRDDESKIIAHLCTKNGRLPQGAPTSPLLSNALLLEFDEWSINEGRKYNFLYSRYADDITISANARDPLQNYILKAAEHLKDRYGLRLNDKKTRIASNRGRQIVTGVVVNEVASPSRNRVRLIRAIFHKASIKPKSFVPRINELAGYIGYMRQFPKLRGSAKLAHYSTILAEVRRHLPPKTRAKPLKKAG